MSGSLRALFKYWLGIGEPQVVCNGMGYTDREGGHSHLQDSSPVIRVIDLVKTYGSLRAVDGIRFDVTRGEKFLGCWGQTERARSQRQKFWKVFTALTPAK